MTNATFHNGEPFTSDVKYLNIQLRPRSIAWSRAEQPIIHLDITPHLGHVGPFWRTLAPNRFIVRQTHQADRVPPIARVRVRNEAPRSPKDPEVSVPPRIGHDALVLMLCIDLPPGKLDWVVPCRTAGNRRNDPRFNLWHARAGIPDFIALNTRVAPFDNPMVRQAVALAINRSEIRDLAYLGTGELGLEEVPTGSNWYDATGIFAATTDIDRAKELLAKAGFANGLTIEYLGLSQYPELLKTGQVVREQLKKIGIE